MKQRILTDRERKEIEAYIVGKKSSTIIRMLKYRAKKYLTNIKKEIELLETIIEKKDP